MIKSVQCNYGQFKTQFVIQFLLPSTMLTAMQTCIPTADDQMLLVFLAEERNPRGFLIISFRVIPTICLLTWIFFTGEKMRGLLLRKFPWCVCGKAAVLVCAHVSLCVLVWRQKSAPWDLVDIVLAAVNCSQRAAKSLLWDVFSSIEITWKKIEAG